MEEYFKVTQKALIKKGEKVLIAKRSPDEKIYPNKWDFFGGKMEIGENPSDSLKREVREETGLDLEIGKPEFVFSEKVKEHFVYCVLFETEIVGEDKICLSEEHTEFKWATKEEILKLDIENYLKAYLQRSE